VAQFDADIALRVAVEGLDKAVRQVERAVNKVNEIRLKVKTEGASEVKKLENSFKRLLSLSKGLAAGGALGTVALVLKDLEKARFVGGAIKQALGPIDGLTNTLGNFTEAAVQAAASAPGLAAGLTAATVAAVAFSPQIGRAVADTLKLSKAFDRFGKGQIAPRLEQAGAGLFGTDLGQLQNFEKALERLKQRLYDV
jgi:hypothetical protein